MAFNYTNVALRDFSGGIDQSAAPNSISDTYSEDLQNVVASNRGFLAKRPGYQGYYGYIPVRVKSITHAGTSISFTLDDAIEVNELVDSPIVVYGKLSASQSGDWSNSNNAEYYTTISTNIRTLLDSGGSSATVTEGTHGVSTDDVNITLLENTDTSTKDWSMFFADRTDIATSSSFDVDIEYTVPTDVTTFATVTSAATVSNSTYTNTTDFNLIDTQTCTFTAGASDIVNVTGHGLSNGDTVQFTTTGSLPTLASGTFSASTTYYVVNSNTNDFQISATSGGAALDFTDTGSGTHTVAAGDIIIPQSTHGFDNNNIIGQVWELDGSEYYKILPDEFKIDSSTGDITIEVLNASNAVKSVKVALIKAAAANFVTAQVGTGSANGTDHTETITVTGDFYAVSVYENNAGTLSQVIPNSVVKDESAGTLDINIVNSGTTLTYYMIYHQVTLSSSTITVTDNGATSTNYTDTSPQLTIWGLPHSDLYSSSSNQEGHTTHIDSYKTSSEERLITGLGGNLFTADTRSESGSDYLIPTTNVDISGTIASDVSLAPCFDVTGSVVNRTRGLVTADNVSDNKAVITAVEFVSSGVAKYTLSLTNKSGSLSTAISVTAATADKLTVTGMAHDVHNGTFTITAVDNSADTITVSNSNLLLDDFDETGAQGSAAIYTDQVTLSANSEFLPSDTFLTGVATTEPTVSTSSSTTVVLSGITAELILPANLTVYGSRSTSVVPVDSTDNFVRGDMCSLGSLAREVRIIGINTASDLTISTITGTGSVATLTTSSAHGLVAGQKVVILRSGVSAYDGTQTITSILTDSSFTFASTETTSASTGVVLGKTIEIDETTTIADSSSNTALSVVGRWIPIEAPTTSDDIPATTYYRHLDAKDYEKQDILRSVMVKDNMYFTNSNDEVLKFDGTSLYQAGLFRWQPQLFSQVDTTTGSIVVNPNSADISSASGNIFTVSAGHTAPFTVGDRIEDSNDNARYTITGIDSTNNTIAVTPTISGSSHSSDTLTSVTKFRYYFRLNAIDANDNIIASAVTGADDFYVEMGGSAAQIKMRLLGMPIWGNYDYDKLELEVYRTLSDTVAPFRRVAVLDMSFNAGDGYIDFTDAVTDTILENSDSDAVNVALKGAELGTSWSHPLMAKHITTADNRLILGNITDYPELDIVIRGDNGPGTVTAANLNTKKYLFRKDATDTGTTTNMTDRATYEFVTSGSVDILPSDITFVDGDVDVGDDHVTKTNHGLLTGHKVQLTTTGTLPGGLSVSTDYYIIKVDANDFRFATSLANAAAGTAVTITSAAGGGTHTVDVYPNISNTSTTFTVNSVAHGLSAGDWIYMYHNAEGVVNSLTYAGWWQIASVNTDDFTVNANMNTAATVNDVDRYVAASTTTDIPVWLGTDGNLNQLNENPSSISEIDAMKRLASAINASMRMTDTTVETDFVPWMVANAGSEYNAGQIVVRTEKVISTTPEVKLAAAITGATQYVGEALQSASAEVSATSRTFNSRVLISYRNFPEIFDNPFGEEVNSDSVIDVNPADGQEVTGIIPFFGDAVFGTGQVEDVLVIFKTKSIYLLNIKTRSLSKLDSRGLGCTAPFSIASTRRGIMFANNSSIYRLNRDQSLTKVGDRMDRLYLDDVDRDNIDKATGHHYSIDGQYKLSLPVITSGTSQATNNQVFVYSHDREDSGRDGSWVRFTNHAATGWVNQGTNAMFATTDGQVFKIRNAGDETDYRDDASAVADMVILLRAESFDNPGVRKILKGITSHFHMRKSSITALVLTASTDLDGTFTAAGTITLTKGANDKLDLVRSALPVRKAAYLQLKYTDSTKDEDVILSGVDYRVAIIGDRGIIEAAEQS